MNQHNEERKEEREEDAPPAKRRRLESIQCQVCEIQSSKYTCPGCRINYCSLACSSKHKIDTKCTGKRDKTAFVPIDSFSARNMQSDYHFLEEAKVKKYASFRNRVTTHIDSHEFQYHPPHVKFLQQKAGQRGIVLSVMPEGMERRKTNTTRFVNRENKLYWHAHLIFDHVKMDNQKSLFLINTGVAEDTILFDLVKKVLDKNVEGSNPMIRSKLEKYVAVYEQAMLAKSSANVSDQTTSNSALEEKNSEQKQVEDDGEVPFICLMKCTELPSNITAYYKLDIHKSLNDNLNNKVVIEYPEILVILPIYASDYPEITEQQLQDIKQRRDEKAELRKKKKEEFEKKKEEYEKRQAEYEQRQAQRMQQQ